MTVNILGTEYEIEYKSRDEVQKEFDDEQIIDGYCDDFEKKIVIVDKMPEECTKMTIRHEIIHAFLFESGLGFSWERPSNTGHDETTVDWFARQWDKIQSVFKSLEI